MATLVKEPDIFRSTRSIRVQRQRTLVERYGGFHWGSDFIGFAVAIFFTILFFGIVGAIVGTVGYQLHAPVPKLGGHMTNTTQQLGIGGLIGGLVALFLAYLIGGYTAGRMARFDGLKNGVGTVIWTIIAGVILGIAGAVIGARFNVASQLHLNIDRTTLTVGGTISIVVALLIMLLAAMVGGTLGARYHRAIDRDIGEMGVIR
jgi:hypothetical protein